MSYTAKLLYLQCNETVNGATQDDVFINIYIDDALDSHEPSKGTNSMTPGPHWDINKTYQFKNSIIFEVWAQKPGKNVFIGTFGCHGGSTAVSNLSTQAPVYLAGSHNNACKYTLDYGVQS